MKTGHGSAVRRRRLPVEVRLETLETRQLLATFSVTNVSDSGAGSLRQAILSSNSASGTNTINFNIPGTGVQTIALVSPLPTVNNPAIIDATTQPGYSGTPLIELDGANIFQAGVTPPTLIFDVDGLDLSGGASTVEGLAINRFTGNGINATGDGNTIAANDIGTDPTGTRSLGNGFNGIQVSSRNNTIGGLTSASRNIISGNKEAGIFLGSNGGQPSGNVVEGNFIGTDATGTLDLGNAQAGVNVQSSSNVIGGNVATLGNVIAFNGGAGVQVGYYSYQSGVIQDKIVGNSIFGNAGLGIDLGGDGVTFNHPGGAGYGPNNQQNDPTLTSAYASGGGTIVEGTLNATPGTTYTVNFYSTPAADPSGFGEGKTPIGSGTFTTDATGNVDITSTLTSVPTGQYVSATATDGSGDTSEFARSLVVASAARADLSLTTSNPSPTPQAGVAATYSFTVQNLGPSKATNVVFTNTLPQGATFLSGNSSQGALSQSGGVITASVGDLASGASATITFTYSIPAAGSATNLATVQSDQVDPTPANNTITQNFQVAPAPAADLSLYGTVDQYSVQAGTELTYTFVVTNFSGNPASGVVFSDTLPSTVVFDSTRSSQGFSTEANGVVTANLGTIPGGANATVTIAVKPTAAGTLSNTATVSANEPDPDAINNQTTVTSQVTPAPAVDVAVSVAAAPQPVNVGQSFTYAVLVGNPGTTTATGVTLTDILPKAVTIGSIRPSQGTYTLNGNVLTVLIGSITPGALTEVTITVTAGAPGTIVNNASVTTDEPEFNISNNYDTQVTAVIGDPIAPAVLDQKLIVNHNKITAIVLTFNKDLDPTSASNILNYLIEDLNQNGSLNANGPKVALASATYNAASRSVTLTPKSGLQIGRFYKLVVNGPGAPGLVDNAGNALDGVANGLQNSIFESLVARGTKSRPVELQLGVKKPNPPKHTTTKHHH